MLALRDRLDALKVKDICWEPYKEDQDDHLLHEIVFFSGVINCGSIVELYQFERIFRQFGFIQSILPPSLALFNMNLGKLSIKLNTIG